jgi:hypothetical protein
LDLVLGVYHLGEIEMVMVGELDIVADCFVVD